MCKTSSRSAWRSSAAIWLTLVSFAGWAGDSVSNPATPPRGATPDLRDGYNDGCMSGYNGAGREGFQTAFIRDAARYTLNGAYRRGWNDGYAACFQDQRTAPRMVPPR